MSTDLTPADELFTLRDIWRYAISRFNAADLVFGHGTTNARDEAAFIVLESLHLPIDELEPWLDARLTRPERIRLLEIVEQRIETRKPAAYLLNKCYIQGVPFYVDERVIVPRSFIGELMFSEALGPQGFDLLPDPEAVESVLDLCTGSGCLAILAAGLFPNARVDAVDLSKDALEVARINVENHGFAEQITLHHGDLFAPLKGRRYDLIITNPPYVTEDAVAHFPPEYAAEPVMAHVAGADGLGIVRRILKDVGKHLTPDGGLICEIGQGRELLEAEIPLPFTWLDTEASEGEVFWLPATALKAGK